MEKKKRKITIWDILFWVAVAGVLVSGGVLAWKLWGYQEGQQTYEQLKEEYIIEQPPEQQEQSPVEPIDLQKLHQTNPDVVGWIEIDGIGISYPILQSKDNEYYLYRLPDGKYNASGSLFLDYTNKSWNDMHTLVYGHNMRDGSMLAGILKYLNKDFYEEQGGEIYLHTLDGVWKYEMLSIAQVPPDSSIYTLGFSQGEQYNSFLQQVKKLSVYETGVEPEEDTPMMTLSTCTKDGKNRVVLSAVRSEKIS